MSEFDKKLIIFLSIFLIVTISIFVPIIILNDITEIDNNSSPPYSVNCSYDYYQKSPFVIYSGSDTFSFTMESTTKNFAIQFIPGSINIEGDLVTITIRDTQSSGSLGNSIYIHVEDNSNSSGYPVYTDIKARFTVK